MRVIPNGSGYVDTREALFGGVGEVRVWDLLGATALHPFTAVLACELAPGGRVGVHVQEHDPEIVVFTEGSGEVEVDGVVTPVSIGSMVALTLGSTLSIANVSTELPLCYLIVKARGH